LLEVYNVTDEHSYSVRELASMMARRLGVKWDGRSLPLPLAKVIARVGDALSTLAGKQFPLTSSRLEALIETTHFSCEKLLATGFRHPQTTEEGIAEMVKWYRRRAAEGGGRKSEDGGRRSARR
jgi:nucleoside-diphosphate-sugar epimerase